MKKIALGLAFLTLAAVLPANAGIHYQAVTKMDGGGPGDTTVSGWVDGEQARIEFSESGNPMMPAGTFLVSHDGAKTIYLVNPKEKTYSKWDLDAMMQFAGNMMQGMGGLMKMEFSEPKVVKLLEEAGGTIAGMSTTHYQFRTTYTMDIRIMGMRQHQSVTSEQEIWSTMEVTDMGLGLWLRRDPPSFGDENLDKLVRSEMDKIHGFPLKTVTVSKSVNEKGKETVTRMTMEVTKFDNSASIPAGTFTIDPTYTETPMPMMGMAADEDGEQQEAQPQNPLKGLFGRKNG